MTAPGNVRSCWPKPPREAASLDDLLAMAQRAWRERGIVVLWPERITDDWTRQAIVNAAEAAYGKRSK